MLLIVVDQLGAPWLPVYGHPVVQAPSLDELAGEGVVFDNAYCPSPLCAPSRASMLTGRLPSETGVFDNAAELPASTPTLAHRLRAEGYSTCLAGKMHFVGPDQLHGFDERLTTDIYPADFEWTPDWRRPLGDPLPWYHTTESIRTPAPSETSMQVEYDEEVAFRAVRHLHDVARNRRARPFFLCASFTHPHDPWEVPSRYWDRYEVGSIGPPAVAAPPLEATDPHSRRLREMCGIDAAQLTAEEIRTARHGYYAAISYVDEKIGQLLDTLRATGLDEQTTVVATSDHGEMLGERGLWFKMSFHEPSARVPLIVRPAGRRASRRVDEPVSLVDLVPTLVEVATGRPPGPEQRLDGRSLVALLDGGSGSEPSPPVLAEYLAEGVTAPAVMIRRGRWKYIACPGDPDLLFDMAADPSEVENLAERPEMTALVGEFRRQAGERWDLAGLRDRVVTSQDERRQVAAALRRGVPPAWDHEPRFPASEQYVRTREDMYELQRRARLGSATPRPATDVVDVSE